MGEDVGMTGNLGCADMLVRTWLLRTNLQLAYCHSRMICCRGVWATAHLQQAMLDDA